MVPVYKAENFIKACFDSVVAQNYTGLIECVFVDDCGGDNSIKILENEIDHYRGSISFRIICHDKNKGVATSRNTLIRNATGEYFFFLDSDDVITPDCISLLTSQLSIDDFDFVIGGHKVTDMKHPIPMLQYDQKAILTGEEIMKSFAEQKWTVFPVNKLCKRGFILENNLLFKDGIIHEDVLWSFMLSCMAKKVCIVPSVTYNYIMRDHSITSPDNNLVRWESYEIVWEEMNRYMVNHKQINHHTLSYLNTYLIYILGYKVNSLSEFSGAYKRLRATHIIPLWDHLRTNGKVIKYHLKDFHYFFPWYIARYWEFQIVKRLR